MQPLPPKYKTVVDPKTGRLETVEDLEESAQEKLERMRRATRDVIQGNVQFHDDPLSKFYKTPEAQEAGKPPALASGDGWRRVAD